MIKRMKVFLITGGPNTGKTTLIRSIAEWLLSSDLKYTKVRESNTCSWDFMTPNSDFSIMVSNRERNILIHSATDDSFCMNALKEFLEALKSESIDIDILITTCRRYDDNLRTEMCKKFGWTSKEGYELLDCDNEAIMEVPLHHIRYDNFETTYRWQKLHMERIIKRILQNPPYNI